MSKFDTHGGYFAPKDYLKVNEGGSHEENPNGGVQIGVDPEGTPNLLEEGEPVYKDYVFSDNIIAEKDFLVENNLPAKYSGKLYSKIADDILTEAEERPLDPISRSGLEILLGRLAECQEAQKQRDQQKELEDELAKLSPEELDQLEMMLAQQEQEQMQQPEVPQEQMMGPAEQVPQEQMPMMRCGGKMSRRYDMGGDIPPGTLLFNPETGRAYNPLLGGLNDTIPMRVDENGNLIDYIEPSVAVAYPGKTQAWVDAQTSPVVRSVARGRDDALNWAWDMSRNNTLLRMTPVGAMQSALALGPDIAAGDRAEVGRDLIDIAPYGIGKALKAVAPLAAVDAANISGKIADYTAEMKYAEKELASLKKQLEVVKKGGPGSRDVIRSGIEKMTEKIKFAKGEIKRLSRQLGKSGGNVAQAAESTAETVAPAAEEVAKAAKEHSTLGKAFRTVIDPTYVGRSIWKAMPGSGWRYPASIAGGIVGGIPATAFWSGVGEGSKALIDAYSTPTGVDFGGTVTPYTGYYSDPVVVPNDDEYYYDNDYGFNDEPGIPLDKTRAFGGRINRFDDGGWEKFLKTVKQYQASRVASPASKKYAIDRNAQFWNNRTGRQVETGEFYDPFTQLTHAEGANADPRILEYFNLLDKGINTSTGAERLIDPVTGKLNANWKDIYNYRRTDGDLGIYHLNPNSAFWNVSAQPQAAPSQTVFASATQVVPGSQQPVPEPSAGEYSDNEIHLGQTGLEGSIAPTTVTATTTRPSVREAKVITPEEKLRFAMSEPRDYYTYPTSPRYAGAIGSGLLGLYDIFQSPDKYYATRINPYTPEGRIHLQNQVYNPIDQNMVANAMIAQGNGTNRALRNSGLGSSTGAAILASDNNLTGNLGTGFIQTWDANNQRRNAVIAANNTAEGTRANFDFSVDSARKAALRDAAARNTQNDLLLQRLNYGAESEKYAAVSQQIENALAAISDIGRENFSANQVNNNPALGGYMTTKDGRTVYFPAGAYGMNPWNLAAFGGFLKKLKK